MKSMQTLLKAFDGSKVSGMDTARPKVRRAPVCELLEGRQLLNAAWTPPQGFAGWDATAAKGTNAAAHVHTLDAKNALGSGHAFAFLGAPGGPGHDMRFLGGPKGAPPTSTSPTSTPPKAPSAQLQKDFRTLQIDEKTLRSEIPTSLTSAVKADQATIQKALSSLTQAQIQALRPSAPPSGTTSTSSTSSAPDPTSNLTTALTEAGVPSSEINTITTDMQNLKTAYSTTDPTLQTRIAADEAAIVKDGGPSMPPGGGFMGGMPGMF